MLVSETNRKWWVASAIGTAAGLVLLDETIVGVALPTIARDLSVGLATSHWVVSAYLLTFAAFAAAAGRFADLYGMRRVFLLGTCIFALSSLVAGAAPNAGVLIGARAVQGLGAAIMFPVAFAITTTAFPKEQRGVALGLVAAIGTTMLALGPVIGGVLTTAISWRFIFYINIPLAVLGSLTVVLLARPAPPREVPPADIPGLALLVAGLVLIVLGLMQGSDWGWTNPLVPAAILAGIAALACFAYVERRTEAPLVDVRLFAIPTIAGGALVFFTGQFTKVVVVVFVPIYLQHVVGLSPVLAGAVMLAAVVGSPLVSTQAGQAADRHGSRRPALAGLLATTLGTLLVAAAVSLRSELLVIAALVLWGFALPFNFLPAASAVMRSVPSDRQGEAGGITVTARLLGGVLGMAAASALYAATGRYDAVFYVTAGVMVAVLAVAYATIEREAPAALGAEHPP